MPTFQFKILGKSPFTDDGVALPDVETAWVEALRLTRDVEGFLTPGERWTLEVLQDHKPVFRIIVDTADFRERAQAAP